MHEKASFTIVVPTFNERANIRPLLEALDQCLSRGEWGVIFVDDDSPDDTAIEIRTCQADYSNVDLITRVGRRGLSSACIEGFHAATTPFIAVMDADLQHEESALTEMLSHLREGKAELVIGTRFSGTGGTGDGLSPLRKLVSQSATLLTRALFRVKISDPMSGFFMMKREVFIQVSQRLSAVGFKIMIDIIINHRPRLNITEVPYTMRARHQGESKLHWSVAFEYLAMLISLRLGKVVSTSFIMFAGVGCTGLVIHAVALYLVMQSQQTSFLLGQSFATLCAMTTNFFLNNEMTFRSNILRGSAIISGLLSFYAACSLGALINISISQLLYSSGLPYLMAGLMGALLAAVWNFLTTRHAVWN